MALQVTLRRNPLTTRRAAVPQAFLASQTRVLVTVVLLIFLPVVWIRAMTPPGRTLPKAASALAAAAARPKRVFCFGDSLTAGTSPPGYENYPYGSDLEGALQSFCPPGEPTATVQWRGFPGWTSSSLLTDAGFCECLKGAGQVQEPPFDVVIVLAGTNDLAYESDSETIFGSIQKIHQLALEKGCHTLAVGIPPSGWQAQSASAKALADSVNAKLQSWAGGEEASAAASSTASASARTTYVPFPIQTFDRSSGYWSSDGLHFSKSGYEYLGTSLAPIVAEILWEDD